MADNKLTRWVLWPARGGTLRFEEDMRIDRVAMMPCVMLVTLSASVAMAQGDEAASAAMRAEEAKDWERALKLYEQAYREQPDAYFIYRRVLIYERMGKPDFGLTLIEDNRDALGAHADITDLALVEQRLRTQVATGGAAGGGGLQKPSLVPGLVVTGVGGTLLIVGAVLTIGGRADANSLRCHPISDADKADCGGVTVDSTLTASQFEDESSSAGLRTGLGVGAMVLGAGALGVGIWQLVSARSGARDDAGAEVGAMVAPDGASVSVRWRF